MSKKVWNIVAIAGFAAIVIIMAVNMLLAAHAYGTVLITAVPLEDELILIFAGYAVIALVWFVIQFAVRKICFRKK